VLAFIDSDPSMPELAFYSKYFRGDRAAKTAFFTCEPIGSRAWIDVTDAVRTPAIPAPGSDVDAGRRIMKGSRLVPEILKKQG
jgi:hypothetical protein